VAVWLRAINATKAGIARLIIAIPRDNNAATSNGSALVPFAAGLGMKVRGSHRLGKMAPIQLRRPVIGRERGDKFGPNVYKLSIETHQ
jgi:hypothetical protein